MPRYLEMGQTNNKRREKLKRQRCLRILSELSAC